MKKFDFAVQSISFITAVGLLAASVIENETLGYLTLVQLFLGAWQILSYLFSLVVITRADKIIKSRYLNYTVIVTLYFLVFYLSSFVDVDHDIMMMYLFGPPWVIGLYYYHTCYLKLQIQKSGHSFLDLN